MNVNKPGSKSSTKNHRKSEIPILPKTPPNTVHCPTLVLLDNGEGNLSWVVSSIPVLIYEPRVVTPVYRKKRKKEKRWSKKEECRLRELYSKYGMDWSSIAKEMPNRDVHQCRQKWVLSLDPNVKKGTFSCEEDYLLADYAFGNKDVCWPEVAKLVPGRTCKQCRERSNYLNKYFMIVNNKIVPKE